MKKTSLTLHACITVSPLAAPPEGQEWVPFDPMIDEFSGDRIDLKKWYGRIATRREPATGFILMYSNEERGCGSQQL